MRPHVSTSLLGITPHHDFFNIEDIPLDVLSFWRLDFSLVSLAHLIRLVYISCLVSCCLLSLIHLESYTIISYYILSTL